MKLSWSLSAMLLTALPALAPASDINSEPDRPLDLFQRIARAEMVVRIRVYDGSLRFALVDVLETLKGAPPASRLRIAFRDYNSNRSPGTDMIVFPNGQEEILLLIPYSPARPTEKNKDIFDLYLGQEGRITVPAEGALTLLEAVRQLVLFARMDPATQIDAFTTLLGSENRYLLEAALDEVERLHIAAPALYGRLLSLLVNASPEMRLRSLRLIGYIFASSGKSRDGATPPDESDAALAAVLERARNDAAENVRAQAVIALAAWPKRAVVEGDLRAIAEQDPAQMVRYEAERALFKPR